MNMKTTAIGGNVVAFNGNHGVQVATGSGNTVVSNVIHSNGGAGINLGWDGAGANAVGANASRKFPTLTTAKTVGNFTSIAGTVTAGANQTIYVELFSVPSTEAGGYGEGAVFLGAVRVKTNSAGKATFALNVAKVAAGRFITATATGPDGSTSEFSKALRVG
jgi:hypothetical protein